MLVKNIQRVQDPKSLRATGLDVDSLFLCVSELNSMLPFIKFSTFYFYINFEMTTECFLLAEKGAPLLPF